VVKPDKKRDPTVEKAVGSLFLLGRMPASRYVVKY
jgi:hypothetical protein